jgi:hypothetical protein
MEISGHSLRAACPQNSNQVLVSAVAFGVEAIEDAPPCQGVITARLRRSLRVCWEEELAVSLRLLDFTNVGYRASNLERSTTGMGRVLPLAAILATTAVVRTAAADLIEGRPFGQDAQAGRVPRTGVNESSARAPKAAQARVDAIIDLRGRM